METLPSIPTVEEIDRIKDIPDPVIRNLQITQCYHELSAVLAARTGPVANWCTFAAWASKQAGQSIRKQDLARLLEFRLRASPAVEQAAEGVAAAAGPAGAGQPEPADQLALAASGFTSAVDRVSDAVARGNKKVFEEIALEFARFYHDCLFDPHLDPDRVDRFCESIRPGDPPEGQAYLRQAFSHYAQALSAPDSKARAELILLANIEIGFHEQTRLQPEIAESLDAGLVTFLDLARPLFARLYPLGGWFQLVYLYLRRLLGRPVPLDRAVNTLLDAARIHLRQLITDLMMTLALPSGRVLRLNRDLTAPFPESLKRITHPELKRLLEAHDPTPDSPLDSGAVDWADLPDRLHFIIDLFRSYQETPDLFLPPFQPDQVRVLKDGRLPPGRL